MPQSSEGNKTKKKKGPAPAHQNKFAFRHNPKSKKTAQILSAPIEHCCQRCHDKLEWRKKYRKYKPLTQPSTCNICQERNVTAAYHTVCDTCSRKSTKALQLLEKWQNETGKSSGTCDSGMEMIDQEPNNISSAEECNSTEECKNELAGMKLEPNVDHRYRRVCTICFKAPSIPASDDESSVEDNNEKNRKLRLRELKSLNRKIQRQQQEKRGFRRTENDVGSDKEVEHDDSSEGESLSVTKDSVLKNAAKLERQNEDDPFLTAVGGADKLLTGEAYQRMLLQNIQCESVPLQID